MSEEIPEKTPDKRPFAKLYRDVGVSLRGDTGCVALYFTILTESAWGDHKKRLRRVCEVSAGQFLTSISELQKLAKMHRTSIQNYLAVLAEMGLISMEILPNVGLRLTLTYNCTKNVQDAIKIIKTAGKWLKPTKYEPTGKRRTKKSTQSQLTGKGEDYPVTSDGVPDDYPVTSDCLNSDYPVTSDSLTPFPSSVLEEEGINKNISNERNNLPSEDLSYDFDNFGSPWEETPPPQEPTYNESVIRGANHWYRMIKEKFPKSTVKEKELIPIVEKCIEQMKGIPEISHKDFSDIIGIAGELGTQFQNMMLFKAPKTIMKRDANNTSIFEELCEVMRHALQKHFAKERRNRRRTYY